jgi:hypothetical protein
LRERRRENEQERVKASEMRSKEQKDRETWVPFGRHQRFEIRKMLETPRRRRRERRRKIY